tara:strand:- start:620 stop:814 length:195 start_codon:yes stop_codon:yes gene_type:complete
MPKDNEKERVIIDVYYTEDGFEVTRVHTADYNKYPPNNCGSGGFFLYDIAEDYLKDWEIVEDYR